MSVKFDPYHKWLGIPAIEQPPNHYRLLAIPLFEEDADVISNAADRQMAHLRTFQSGAHSAESQQLLNEVSAARKCLLTPNEKTAYDEQLRKRLQPAQAPAAPHSESPSKIARSRATGTRTGDSAISAGSKSDVKKLATRPQSTAPAPVAVSEFDIITDGPVGGPSASSIKHGSSKGVSHPSTGTGIHRSVRRDSRKQKLPIWMFAGGDREGLFRWVNGSQSFYADWKPGAPNNSNVEEHFVGILLTGFGNFEVTPERMKWNDYKAREQFPYVCEWDR